MKPTMCGLWVVSALKKRTTSKTAMPQLASFIQNQQHMGKLRSRMAFRYPVRGDRSLECRQVQGLALARPSRCGSLQRTPDLPAFS